MCGNEMLPRCPGHLNLSAQRAAVKTSPSSSARKKRLRPSSNRRNLLSNPSSFSQQGLTARQKERKYQAFKHVFERLSRDLEFSSGVLSATSGAANRHRTRRENAAKKRRISSSLPSPLPLLSLWANGSQRPARQNTFCTDQKTSNVKSSQGPDFNSERKCWLRKTFPEQKARARLHQIHHRLAVY